SYSFYEGIIASENSSPEESNDDDIHEYETSADITSRSTYFNKNVKYPNWIKSA
ncbi:13263_t:CDS:2, partial [Dentiscutata heterogama]